MRPNPLIPQSLRRVIHKMIGQIVGRIPDKTGPAWTCDEDGQHECGSIGEYHDPGVMKGVGRGAGL